MHGPRKLLKDSLKIFVSWCASNDPEQEGILLIIDREFETNSSDLKIAKELYSKWNG